MTSVLDFFWFWSIYIYCPSLAFLTQKYEMFQNMQVFKDHDDQNISDSGAFHIFGLGMLNLCQFSR